MKRRPSPRRLYLLASALGFAGVLFYLSAYWESGQPPGLVTPAVESARVDLYLVNPRSVRYDEQGAISDRFRAPHVRQLHGSDLALAQEPVLTVLARDGEPWTARADQGEMQRQGEEVQLIGAVRINDADADRQLTTQRLTVYPQRKLATTEAPVRLESPGSVTEGRGLRADFQADRFQLLHEVRGRHVMP